MILTNYFIKRKIRVLANKAAKRNHHFRTLEEARDILVFYDEKNRDAVSPCLEALRAMRKKVKTCVYVPKGTPALMDPMNIQLFAGDVLDNLGFPKPEVSRQINELKADILIDLSPVNYYAVKYLVLQHPSDFKVGLNRGEQEMYDLSISVTGKEAMNYLFKQILFYLETIRSK